VGHDHFQAIAVRYETLLGAHLRGLRQPREAERVEVAGFDIECIDHELLAFVAPHRATHVRMIRNGIRGARELPAERHPPVHVHELVVDLDVIAALADLDRRRRRVHDSSERHGLALQVPVVSQRIVLLELFTAGGGQPRVFRYLRAIEQPNTVEVRA
jgi:hypothetical protein